MNSEDERDIDSESDTDHIAISVMHQVVVHCNTMQSLEVLIIRLTRYCYRYRYRVRYRLLSCSFQRTPTKFRNQEFNTENRCADFFIIPNAAEPQPRNIVVLSGLKDNFDLDFEIEIQIGIALKSLLFVHTFHW